MSSLRCITSCGNYEPVRTKPRPYGAHVHTSARSNVRMSPPIAWPATGLPERGPSRTGRSCARQLVRMTNLMALGLRLCEPVALHVNSQSEPVRKTRSLQPLLAACRNTSVSGRESCAACFIARCSEAVRFMLIYAVSGTDMWLWRSLFVPAASLQPS